MSQELERRPATSIDETFRVAKGFAMSGYFADAREAEKAFVKIMAGAEMGLAPFQAMTGIHVISGKPVVGAGLLAAMLDKHPDYDYEVEWEPDEKAPTACTVVIFKGGKERGRSRFSLEDAKRAGLTQANWQKYPGAMLFARALSQGVRWYAAGITGQSVYVEGELGGDAGIPDPPPAARVIDVTANVTGYADPDDPMDDVPFEDAGATPADRIPAESPSSPEGQIVAPAGEPAATLPGSGGGLIETLDDAKRLLAPMNGEQVGLVKQMLKITETTTKPKLALELLTQFKGWDEQDILGQIVGWA